MSGVVSRFVKASLAVYDPICKAFAMDDLQGLRVAIETGTEQLTKVFVWLVFCFCAMTKVQYSTQSVLIIPPFPFTYFCGNSYFLFLFSFFFDNTGR